MYAAVYTFRRLHSVFFPRHPEDEYRRVWCDIIIVADPRDTSAQPKAQGNSRRANEKEKFSPFNFLFSSTQKKVFLFSAKSYGKSRTEAFL